MVLSSWSLGGSWGWCGGLAGWDFAVGEAGGEHLVEDVAAAAGEAEEGGVVFLALGALAGVVVTCSR